MSDQVDSLKRYFTMRADLRAQRTSWYSVFELMFLINAPNVPDKNDINEMTALWQKCYGKEYDGRLSKED